MGIEISGPSSKWLWSSILLSIKIGIPTYVISPRIQKDAKKDDDIPDDDDDDARIQRLIECLRVTQEGSAARRSSADDAASMRSAAWLPAHSHWC